MTSKATFTTVNKDKNFSGTMTTKRDRIPVYTSLPFPVHIDGSIIYNRGDATYYGSDGLDWIPLGGNAETGTGVIGLGIAQLNPNLVAAGPDVPISLNGVSQTFGAGVPLPVQPVVQGSGTRLSPGVWSVRARAKVQSLNNGAAPGDATVEILLDGNVVLSDFIITVSRTISEIILIDGYINVPSGTPGILTMIGRNPTAGSDTVSVSFGWYAAVHRLLTY